ncbi:YwqJ-related putative deaminase [Streptomyces sp. NPDC001777]|uniref:YwqJ-related putative deaminase n=1 Tax=Streptomyces sp. NPDC001777 TaxID=3364608 RepID=UPI0036CC468F
MFEQFPATASSLLVNGQVVSHTSLIGEGTVNLHPAIRSFVDSLPARTRKSFTGNCAEAVLVSDQLWALDSTRDDGLTTSLAEAVPHFAKSAIVSKMVRGHGHPDHGRTTSPCPVCRLLLQELGVQVMG